MSGGAVRDGFLDAYSQTLMTKKTVITSFGLLTSWQRPLNSDNILATLVLAEGAFLTSGFCAFSFHCFFTDVLYNCLIN